jgi:myo-inositol-1(or 4)-monophosphatase
MAPGIEKLSEFAMDAIHQAGEKAMAYYGKGKPHLKFDESVVTEAENQLTDVFQNRLNQQFPEHQMFRYGDVNENYSHGQKRYLWIFDPLEGVANFQGGMGHVYCFIGKFLADIWCVLHARYRRFVSRACQQRRIVGQ